MNSRTRTAYAVLASCLVAGTLDILAAMLVTLSHNGPVTGMLKAIASGVLGAQAFRGGDGTAALGLLLHFLIMAGIACTYALVATRFALARTQPFVAGAIYGVLVYAVMELVVLPLSMIAFKQTFSMPALVRGIAIHIACVGIPIALIMKAMLLRKQPA